MFVDDRYNNLELEIFSDEITETRPDHNGHEWIYIAALFVPVINKTNLISQLNNHRCREKKSWNLNSDQCENKCKYHLTNNTEIHYKEIHKNRVGKDIALDWVKDLVVNYPRSGLRPYYLSIMGLNYSKLNTDLFGDGKGIKLNMYNRFYRTILKRGFSFFFRNYTHLKINNIYHDSGSQEKHQYFAWHSIKKIREELNHISFENDRILFIDSDHRESYMDESHLIQFTDLLLGATLNCLHFSSSKTEKMVIGQAFKPVLKVLMNQQPVDRSCKPYYGSRYDHCFSVSFFPNEDYNSSQKSLNREEITFPSNNFYCRRNICLPDPENITLDKWL